MKRVFIISLLLVSAFLLGTTDVFATRAYPGIIQVTQPDGSVITIRRCGDEFFNYTTTASGSLIARKADGFYYHASFSGVQIVPSSQRAVSTSRSVSGWKPITLPGAVKQLIKQRREIWSRNMERVPGIPTKTNARSTTTIESLVILVQFSDLKFTVSNPQSTFSAMLNQEGYAENRGTGSARDYYYDNSMGRFDFNFVVPPVVTLSKSYLYYGKDEKGRQDVNMAEMVNEACRAAQNAGLDFARFDTDGDGVVDNVFFYFAGHNQAEGAEDNTIWPHRSYVNDGASYNGKRLGGYACTSELRMNEGREMVGIGTFCHEFGHVLGLCDLYDTDYEKNGQSSDELAYVTLMSGGNYLNDGRTPPNLCAIDREYLGWLAPDLISEEGNYTVEGIEKNRAYRIKSGNPDEYFLIEHRNNDKWDMYLMGKGLLVYHIDKSSNRIYGYKASQLWQMNMVNAYASHPCARLLPSTHSDSQNYFYPGETNRTDLSLEAWNTRRLPYSLSGISLQGKESTFTIIVSDKMTCHGKVTDASGNPIADANVYLAQVEPSVQGAGGIRMFVPSVSSRSNLSHSVVTDGKGEFQFEYSSTGTYMYIVTKRGYINSVGHMEMQRGDNVLEVVMKSESESKLTNLSWASSPVNALQGMEGEGYLGQRFDADDLKPRLNNTVESLYFYSTYAGSVTVGININGKAKITQNVRAIEGFNMVDLMNQNLSIGQGEEWIIYVKYSNVKADDALVMISSGTVAGKGDLYSWDGKEWYSLLKDSELDASVCIGLYLLDRISVSCTPLQHDAYFDFATFNPDGKNATLTVTDMVTGKSVIHSCGNVTSYLVRSLETETAYRYSLVLDGEESGRAGEFVTGKVVSDYASMYEAKVGYAKGDRFPLALLNVPEDAQSIQWYVDGAEYKESILTLVKSVKLEAVITYAPDDVERIIREIVIEDKVTE